MIDEQASTSTKAYVDRLGEIDHIRSGQFGEELKSRAKEGIRLVKGKMSIATSEGKN